MPTKSINTADIVRFINRNLSKIQAQNSEIHTKLVEFWDTLNRMLNTPLTSLQKSKTLYAVLLTGMNLIAANGAQPKYFERNSQTWNQLIDYLEQYQNLPQYLSSPSVGKEAFDTFPARIYELGEVIDYNCPLDKLSPDYETFAKNFEHAISNTYDTQKSALTALIEPLKSLYTRIEYVIQYDDPHTACLQGEIKCKLAHIYYQLYTITPTIEYLSLVQTAFLYTEEASAIFKQHPTLHATLSYFAQNLDKYQRTLFLEIKSACETQNNQTTDPLQTVPLQEKEQEVAHRSFMFAHNPRTIGTTQTPCEREQAGPSSISFFGR